MKLAAALPILFYMPEASSYTFGNPSPRYIIRMQPQGWSQPLGVETIRALQAPMSSLYRDSFDSFDRFDRFDPFDPFEMNSFFLRRPTMMRRNQSSLSKFFQSIDDANSMVMKEKKSALARPEIIESPDKYDILINMPEGMKTKDITLELVRNNEVLHLSGEHKEEKDNIMRRSRINRMFTLSKNADVSKISAKLSKGVLQVTVPKVEVDEVKENRKIEITEDVAVKAADKDVKTSESASMMKEDGSLDAGEEVAHDDISESKEGHDDEYEVV